MDSGLCPAYFKLLPFIWSMFYAICAKVKFQHVCALYRGSFPAIYQNGEAIVVMGRRTQSTNTHERPVLLCKQKERKGSPLTDREGE